MMDLKKDIEDFDDIFFISDGVFCINEDKKNTFVKIRQYGIDEQKYRFYDIENIYLDNEKRLSLEMAEQMELPLNKRRHSIEDYSKTIDFLAYKRNELSSIFENIKDNFYKREEESFKSSLSVLFKSNDLDNACSNLFKLSNRNYAFEFLRTYNYDNGKKKNQEDFQNNLLNFSYELLNTNKVTTEIKSNYLKFKSGDFKIIFSFERENEPAEFMEKLELFTAIKKKEMIDKNMDKVINLKIDLSTINENRSNKCNDDIDNDLSVSFKI